jgi:hypothetical protein
MPLRERRWIASFLAMTEPGRNDGPLRHCEAHSQVRHCEARSAVAIYAVARAPMDCFVPRNDRTGVQ